MKALRRFCKIMSNERGNVLVVGAASLPLLIGAAAFAVDSITLALSNRQLQRAADSSAIAGAYALSQGESAPTAANNDLDENRFPDLSQAAGVTVGPSHGFQRTVQVQLRSRLDLPFMSIFTSTPSEIQAVATAALVDEGSFCVISLYDGEDTGIDVNGSGNLALGCGMKANSHSEQAITAGGASRVSGTPIAAVGGLDGETNNFAPPTRLQPHSAPQEDPLARVPNPPDNYCTASAGGLLGGLLNIDLSIGPASVQTLTPGCYRSLDIKGAATLLPGTYYINGGDVDIGAQATVIGLGVTIVLTGPNGQAGNLRINAGANLNMTSTGTGPYAGVLFYRDRRAPLAEVSISGGASLFLTGALYFPSSNIDFVGHSGMNVRCLQLVGQKMRFRGDANIRNDCPEDSGASAFRQNVVRLVQ
jgi:hypothetical protein